MSFDPLRAPEVEPQPEVDGLGHEDEVVAATPDAFDRVVGRMQSQEAGPRKGATKGGAARDVSKASPEERQAQRLKADAEVIDSLSSSLARFAVQIETTADSIRREVAGKDPRGPDPARVNDLLAALQAESCLSRVASELGRSGYTGTGLRIPLMHVKRSYELLRQAVGSAPAKFYNAQLPDWLGMELQAVADALGISSLGGTNKPVDAPARASTDNFSEAMEASKEVATYLRMAAKNEPSSVFRTYVATLESRLVEAEEVVDELDASGRRSVKASFVAAREAIDSLLKEASTMPPSISNIMNRLERKLP